MKTPHRARHSASAAHQRKWTAKWRGISGCTSRKICGSNTPWRRRRQRWTPRRRPHVSGPAGKQVRPQRKRNCRVDNKPIRQGPRPRRIRKIPCYFRLADQPDTIVRFASKTIAFPQWFDYVGRFLVPLTIRTSAGKLIPRSVEYPRKASSD